MKTLKKWREELGITQMQLAELTDMTRSRISSLDNLENWSNITIAATQKIAAAFGVGIEKFLGDDYVCKKTLSIYYAKTEKSNMLVCVDEPTNKAKCVRGDHHGLIGGVIDLRGKNAAAALKRYFNKIPHNLIGFDGIQSDCNDVFDFDASEFASLELVYRHSR